MATFEKIEKFAISNILKKLSLGFPFSCVVFTICGLVTTRWYDLRPKYEKKMGFVIFAIRKSILKKNILKKKM